MHAPDPSTPNSAAIGARPERHRATWLVLPLVLILGGVAACGGGGGDNASTTTTEPVSVVRWTAEVNTLCERSQDFVDDLLIPEDQAALASYLEVAVSVLENQFDNIADMEAPPEIQADLDAALALAEENLGHFERGLAAQAAGDDETVAEAVTAIGENALQIQVFFDENALDRCWAGGSG